jgi:hypothetical protein
MGHAAALPKNPEFHYALSDPQVLPLVAQAAKMFHFAVV